MSALSELYKEIESCNRCDLFRTRTRAVPGEGPENAEIMFIGEAPGWNEDQQGRPFVGAAGQFLESLLAMIGLKREQVYITNVVKGRPPANRDPLPAEINACNAWLDRQIEIIRPRMIVTLGRYSLAKFFPGKSISKVHGIAEKRDSIIYYPMYHPAAALHQQSLRRVIEEDIRKIPSLLSQVETIADKQEEPKQLNLFE
jgi:DNA polymerase